MSGIDWGAEHSAAFANRAREHAMQQKDTAADCQTSAVNNPSTRPAISERFRLPDTCTIWLYSSPALTISS